MLFQQTSTVDAQDNNTLPVWIILSPAYHHISINSRPFLVGIVSATAKAQGLNSRMDPNFTPGSDEHEQQLFQEQQDFLYSVLISSLKTEFSEDLVKDHEGHAQLILELLHEHHTGNSQYTRAEIK